MFEVIYKLWYGMFLKFDREFVGVGDVFLMIFGCVVMNCILVEIVIKEWVYVEGEYIIDLKEGVIFFCLIIFRWVLLFFMKKV